MNYLSFNPGKVAASNVKCTWGLPDTLRVLRGAEQILLPLNVRFARGQPHLRPQKKCTQGAEGPSTTLVEQGSAEK